MKDHKPIYIYGGDGQEYVIEREEQTTDRHGNAQDYVYLRSCKFHDLVVGAYKKNIKLKNELFGELK